MFKSLKKKATTAFRKKKGSTSQLPVTPETQSTSSSFTQTQTNSTLDRRQSEVAPLPPPSPPQRPATPALPRPPTPPVVPALGTEPETEHILLQFEEQQQPTAEEPVAHQPEPDPFAPKYVPFVEATPLRNNMFGGQTGIYGRVNPDIMGGFGGDDESIWLVDDAESDEERQQDGRDDGPEPQTETRPPEDTVETTEPLTVVETQSTGATAGDAARPAFIYRAPALLDDDEWLSPSVSTPETQPEPETPVARRGYAPISTSILDLAQFDFDEGSIPIDEPEHTQKPVRSEAVPPASSSSNTNPYVALFEQQENAMTLAYLRRLEMSENTAADDFSFGQRYQRAADTSDVIVTRQRVPRAALIGEVDCIVCADTKLVTEFPRFSITAACTHPPNTCLDCIQMSIESDLNSKLWTEIRCPECRELLEYADIQRYANKQTFIRYEALAIRAAMSEAENFVWCTSGCGSGQIHESGDEQPIVTCLHCNHRSCFHHSVAWHENISCSEYDQLLADPENFRSQVERDNEEWTEAQRAQLEADRAMAQGLLAEEQAEIQRREERARQEREQARKAAELIRQIAARRRQEENQSQATLSRTTKPCPGCGWAIEKNDGCSHMTCIKCRYEFCWACNAMWSRSHSINCRRR